MGLSLEKIDRHMPHLSEHARFAKAALETVGLYGHEAEVALCIDISGTMNELIESGKIQRLAEKVLVFGSLLDQDDLIDVFLFGDSCYNVGQMKLNEISPNYIKAVRQPYRLQVQTHYEKAMKAVRKHYMGNDDPRSEPLKREQPVIVFFVTDGDTMNQDLAEEQLRTAAYEPIFWQFLAIGKTKHDVTATGVVGWIEKNVLGTSDFTFLERLDDMTGRFTDNANFASVASLEQVSDEKLYDLILTEYLAWLAEAREKGLLDT